MTESIEKFEAGIDSEWNVSSRDRDWVEYSLEKDIVNPKEGNEKIYIKLSELHAEMWEDTEISEATADVHKKLDELKSSLA